MQIKINKSTSKNIINIFVPGNIVISKKNDVVVFVTTEGNNFNFSGCSINNNDGIVPVLHSEYWVKDNFKLFEGTLELSN